MSFIVVLETVCERCIEKSCSILDSWGPRVCMESLVIVCVPCLSADPQAPYVPQFDETKTTDYSITLVLQPNEFESSNTEVSARFVKLMKLNLILMGIEASFWPRIQGLMQACFQFQRVPNCAGDSFRHTSCHHQALHGCLQHTLQPATLATWGLQPGPPDGSGLLHNSRDQQRERSQGVCRGR